MCVAGLFAAGCGGGGEVRTGDPEAHGTSVVRYEIDSRYAGRTLSQVGVTPPDSRRRPPLLVFLHGRGKGGAESNVNGAFLDALRALGPRAPAVVFPDGGDHSYWHDRRGGAWGRYVVREVIPQAVRRLRADPRRVAIGGISMGGFGAFDIALHSPSRFCAVGGHSPAIWASAGETAPGAFDDAEDFARHDVIALARARRLRRPAWLDSGDEDPFAAASQVLAQTLGVEKHTWAGGHEADYWHAHYDEYLRFYARALERC
ncbi:MAG TPA: alpha/beta hydrolase-fold protein [Thermoleophilaceae bacterium]